MDSAPRAIAVVGLGAILPDAGSPSEFWNSLLSKRYSIATVPPDRWSAADYYDPDPAAPDKTYSQIGGWVRNFVFDWKRYKLPPKVIAAMDQSQQWAVDVAGQALADYGYPARPLDTERLAVVLGTAMGGELHYLTHLRIAFPEYARALQGVPEFERLPRAERAAMLAHWHAALDRAIPPITEDSMPGELPNIVSGRVANLLNLRGPNFVTDAACASALAAVQAAIELLERHEAEAVITGGVDRNMGVSSFVKFCKIGALSATGTRPFGEGADGFVMGEGAAAFLLKRLEDAQRAGDRIYAVIRGIGGASDGKGKGITAPNPIGQRLAIQRAWENAGLDPATATLVEAHGTSTKVGDVVEVESLAAVFGAAPPGAIGLGSVKSNIGHLKAAAGAAGLLKAVLALQHATLPPTLNAESPNASIDFTHTPFSLLHEAREWKRNGSPRRCGVSAYGFGGTNFHVVLEEHPAGAVGQRRRAQAAGVDLPAAETQPTLQATRLQSAGPPAPPAPPRGMLALGAGTVTALKSRLDDAVNHARTGWIPPRAWPEPADLAAPERLVVDFGGLDELVERLQRARQALDLDSPAMWKALQAQGIFRGSGPAAGKVAFLFPGQGSQYLNMGRDLSRLAPPVAEVLAEADRVMTPILGGPLMDFVFVDQAGPAQVQEAEDRLQETAITQPAMLALDLALHQLLAAYGFRPDVVMGHSLGEYAALVAAGCLKFAEALEAVAARGTEMAKVSVEDNGWMAAVMAPYEAVERTLSQIDGYVVGANINGRSQCVIGGTTAATQQAIDRFRQLGYEARRLPVSHAFHTRIVAPARKPLRAVLDRLRVSPPTLPLVANVTGEFYPQSVAAIRDLLEQQVAAPVQWMKGLETLYQAGARTFVEVGPKKALKGLVDDVLGDRPDVVSLYTNHPKTGELASFNQALCGLCAAGHAAQLLDDQQNKEASMPSQVSARPVEIPAQPPSRRAITPQPRPPLARRLPAPVFDRNAPPSGSVVISGTGLGLPGAEKPVMDPDNAQRILRGEQFIDLIPERFRKKMLAKRVTRLVKGEDGSGRFEVVTDPAEVVKLAGRPGLFNLAEEYGVPEKLVEAFDISTQLAVAAGLDALREAGLPLAQSWRQTTIGKLLPDRWLLPEPLRDETGVIFASAFPGFDRFADEFERYYTDQSRREQLAALDDLRQHSNDGATLLEIQRRASELRAALDREPYELDRRFLFRVLAMGHSQFAEYIGARGPNTQVNAACATTAQALAIAEDWIRGGRCRRVIVIGADVATSDRLLEWVGAGFMATGAIATDDRVAEAALPFDRRRHGTLLGMGACALVVESEDALRERGMRGIVEVLSTEINNSAYHGTRLDVTHIAQVMDHVVSAAERRFGLNRYAVAPQTVFMSHETYTPARGGSAAAEAAALRHTFGQAANDVIVANTKGFTGHPMGVGIEDVIAVKILETGLVPPVPNLKELDPELGRLNLSRGGRYPVQYAIHLAAGFGSQIALTFTRRIPGAMDRVDQKSRYQRWLADVSGVDRAETEVVKRVLRVKSATPDRPPVASAWQPGTAPVRLALAAAVPQPALAARANGDQPQVAPLAVPVPTAAVPPPRPPAPAAPASPTPAPSPSPTPPVAPQPQARSEEDIAEGVLGLVAEKTGYPREMLELDLDLEADLGIDTVKQAETFAALRTAFNLPRRDELKLRDYPTLQHVINYVRASLAATETPRPGTPAKAHGEVPRATAVGAPLATETANGGDPVTDAILNLVVEKTGYPREMLELDLDLEADLGIDTVKQAEMFAAIRTTFDLPRRDDLRLRDYPTLQHVIGFVREAQLSRAGGQAPGASQSQEVVLPKAEAPEAGAFPLETRALPTIGTLEDADRFPRRAPLPVLRPPLALCKPTGVALGDNSRVIVMPDQSGVGPALAERLRARGASVLMLDPASTTEALVAQIKRWLASGAVTGVYWLPALKVEPSLETMDLPAWRSANHTRVKLLFATMRALYQAVSQPGTFLVAGTRLGGLHGYGPEGAAAPLGGAVTGFVKAFRRERTLCTVKAVDWEVTAEPGPIADGLIAETLLDPGTVEIGYWHADRYGIALIEQSAQDGQPGLVLNAETIFVVTGAAGGITSAIVADLAAHSRGTFYLLDLAELPAAEAEAIRMFRSDREALKQHLIDAAKPAGQRLTPVMVTNQLLTIERQEAALRAVEAVEAAGGAAHYYSVNLLDGPALAAIVDTIRERHGRIDVLVHAGGLEISRALSEKDPAQFDLVFDVKADGFFNLLRAATGLPIAATVIFSSLAGRFGNAGQTDYSAANDLLCKLTSSLRRWRPQTRGLVIDWTAWSGIGMATRGSIPKIMEAAGIETLPPEAGVPTVRRELIRGRYRGEVVVAGRLGVLAQAADETGGLDSQKATQWARERRLLMVGQVIAARPDGSLEVETLLDPQAQPFLRDHAIEGTPLLPGVMGVEAFAQVASLLAPCFTVGAVENVRFERPFKFYHQAPQTLHLSAILHPLLDGDLLARATLRSIARPLKPDMPGQERIHFTADVRLARGAPPAPRLAFERPAKPAGWFKDQIYQVYFHGPAYQVLSEVHLDGNAAIGVLANDLPPDTAPAEAAALMAPRLVELCLQTAAAWEFKSTTRLALPSRIGSVKVHHQPEARERVQLYAVVVTQDGGETFDATVRDEAGTVYVEVDDYRAVSLPGSL